MTFVAGTVLTAAALNSELAAKTDLAMTQNPQTGTSYSMALADQTKLVTMSNAASNTVLVTKQATVVWTTGTQLRVLNLGAGLTTLVADTGVTINNNTALKQFQGGTLIRTASDVWTFRPDSAAGGMDLITPTSVAGSGVTLSGGAISFSAATTISVNGCFSATYQNYVLMWQCVASTGATCRYRMRLSGTDATAATYNSQLVQGTNSSVGAAAYSSETSSIFAIAAVQSIATAQMFSPAVAANTLAIVNGYTYSTPQVNNVGSTHQTATAYDGITIFPDVGNVTGTLKIYGLRNS